MEAQEQELTQVRKSQEALSKQILVVDEKISDLNLEMHDLNDELRDLDREDLVPYWERRQGIQFNKVLIAASILAGSALGAYVGDRSFERLLPVLASTFAGCALAMAVNWGRRYLEYVSFRYTDLPFERADVHSNYGEFKEVENSRKNGVYHVNFFADVWQYSEPRVTIFVKKNTVPKNLARIKAIREILYKNQHVLTGLQAEKGTQEALKKASNRKIVTLETDIKKLMRQEKRLAQALPLPAAQILSSLAPQTFPALPSSSSTKKAGLLADLEAENFFPTSKN
jgi:hypothetical protein